MKLRLTLFLTIALLTSPFAGFSPSYSSYFAWIYNRDKKADPPEEQHPVATRTSNRRCWFGLTTCPIGSGNGNQKVALPEEQLPTDTQHRTFRMYWPSWFGLFTYRVTKEDGDQKTAFHKQQLCTNAWHCPKNRPSWQVSSEHPGWIRRREGKVVTPKDPKPQSPGPRQKVFSWHDTLGRLWDSLAQTSVRWMFEESLTYICIQSVICILGGLWRRIRRLWGQETGPTASASIRTEHQGEEHTASDLLCHMEAEVDRMERYLRTLLQSHQEVCRSRQERKAAQDGEKRKNPSADSTHSAD